jgi:hypothetical protein
VTLVQLCRERESDHDVAALTARVAKLEQAVAAAPAAPPPPVDPSTGRAKLGGHARPAATPPGPEAPAPAAPVPTSSVGDLRTVWAETVRPQLRGLTRAVFAPVEVVGADGDVLTFAAPNPTHQAKCEQHVADVERALRDATGRAVTVKWGSADAAAPPPPAVATPPPPEDDEHHVPDDSKPVLNGGQSVLERLTEAFPGATIVGEGLGGAQGSRDDR